MEKCCNFADFQNVYRNADLTAFYGMENFMVKMYFLKETCMRNQRTTKNENIGRIRIPLSKSLRGGNFKVNNGNDNCPQL